MAKPLVLQFAGVDVPFEMEKVDRRKLYGYVETEAVDPDGRPCSLATLAGDGQTLLGAGSVALTYMDPDGLMVPKSDLLPVDPSGAQMIPVPSSFNSPIPLAEEASVDEYLSHVVRAVYTMHTGEVPPSLAETLQAGRIFTFPFSYRGGLEPDTAFLLSNTEGTIFMALGKRTRIEFVGLEQVAAAPTEDEVVEEEDDSMDFGMM